MPHDPKSRLGRLFDRCLIDRHPVTALWWRGDQKITRLLPEWSADVFSQESARWLHLSQKTGGIEDGEIRHWGRYARWAHQRIQEESWRNAWAVLQHLVTVLTVVELLDPEGARFPREPLLGQMTRWLDRIQGTGHHGYWGKTYLDYWQQLALKNIARLQPPSPPRDWEGLTRGLTQAIHRFVERQTLLTSGSGSDAPWVPPAHVSDREWVARRQEFLKTSPLPKPAPLDNWPLFPVGLSSDEVVKPTIGTWWLKPGRHKDTLVHPHQGAWRDAIGALWTVWRESAGGHALTWALTPPMFIQGPLWALVSDAAQRWPAWPPASHGYLAWWMQWKQALAVADAWLWLEGGDPDEVLKFLERWVSTGSAQFWVVYLKTHPGEMIMTWRACRYWTEAHQGKPYWTQLPIMPDRLFQADTWPSADQWGSAG